MPPKKATVTQVQQEQQTEPLNQDTPADVSERLARIEAAIERMAAPQPIIQRDLSPPATRSRNRQTDQDRQTTPRRSVSHDPALDRSVRNNFHSNIDNLPIASGSGASQQAGDAIQDVRPRNVLPARDVRPDPVPYQPGDPLVNVNNTLPSAQLFDVNISGSSRPWAPTTPAYSHGYSSMPFSSQHPYDYDDVEHRVHDILASTVSTLSRGNTRPYPYPFRYVLRGPERRKVSINSVTLSEHLWGLVRMIRDDKLDPAIRPHLNTHLVEIIEDSCDFEWRNVRGWSEEVFGLIAEDRLPGGWTASSRIQMLRMSMSRLHSARQTCEPDNFPRQRDAQPRPLQQFSQQTDSGKGGPCHAYNSHSGCPLPAGHMSNGKRLQHVCTFCLVNSCAPYTHPGTQCRNKAKSSAHHF